MQLVPQASTFLSTMSALTLTGHFDMQAHSVTASLCIGS